MLYSRDPSLDPQLVWKGKDEQDGENLTVPIVPIYIQEKIHPQAVVENLRDTAKPASRSLSLLCSTTSTESRDSIEELIFITTRRTGRTG